MLVNRKLIEIPEGQLKKESECSICLSEDGKLITHEKDPGVPAGECLWHLDCIKKALNQNSICPNCRDPIENSITSKPEKITNLSKTALEGALLGIENAYHKYVYAAAAVAFIAAIHIAGIEGAQNVLEALGAGFLFALPGGVAGALNGPGGGAEDRISKYAKNLAAGALAVDALALMTGSSQDTFLQAIGASSLLYLAGKASLAKLQQPQNTILAS